MRLAAVAEIHIAANLMIAGRGGRGPGAGGRGRGPRPSWGRVGESGGAEDAQALGGAGEGDVEVAAAPR
ncbi:hypothetical protein GA0070608_0199 [Micromonospora peucetia]|uniref:Uncharacterized protein n=1 Tax=Micromonospora peucetia TaxID=47871 RepID=A0A1C6U095_9ACTN|nr:hypothetical protein GA0070608_0199 [Micromonospora peucetia]